MLSLLLLVFYISAVWSVFCAEFEGISGSRSNLYSLCGKFKRFSLDLAALCCNIVRKSALVPEFACAALNDWSELINGPRCSCTAQTSSAVLSRLCFFSRLVFLICNRNGSAYELGNTMVPPVRPLTKFSHNGRKNGCKMQPFGLTLEPCGESIILHRNLAANIT